MDPRTLLSTLVVVAALVLFLMRRIHRQSAVGGIPWVVLGLTAAIWVPETWRDYLTAGAAAVLILIGSGSLIAMVLTGLIAYGLAWLVPGGASVLILFVLVISAIFVLHGAVRDLRAMQRTRTLKPGEHPSGLIQLGGSFASDRPPRLPGPTGLGRGPVACWRLAVGERSFYSPDPLRLVGDHGHALVDPRGLAFESTHTASLIDADADAAAHAVGIARGDDSVSLRWIELDEPGYVRGLPEWQADRAGAGYRDSSLVPLFCCEEVEDEEDEEVEDEERDDLVGDAADQSQAEAIEDPIEGPQLRASIPCVEHPTIARDRRQLYLANRPLEELLRGARYSLWSWSVWGLACAAVVAVQIIF